VPFGGLGTKPRVITHRWRPSGALELGF